MCDVTRKQYLVTYLVTGYYLRSGLWDVVKMSAEFDDVMKLRLVMLEMGILDRELLGCRSNLTRKMTDMDINH